MLPTTSSLVLLLSLQLLYDWLSPKCAPFTEPWALYSRLRKRLESSPLVDSLAALIDSILCGCALVSLPILLRENAELGKARAVSQNTDVIRQDKDHILIHGSSVLIYAFSSKVRMETKMDDDFEMYCQAVFEECPILGIWSTEWWDLEAFQNVESVFEIPLDQALIA